MKGQAGTFDFGRYPLQQWRNVHLFNRWGGASLRGTSADKANKGGSHPQKVASSVHRTRHDKTLNLNMHDDLRVQRVIQGFCERGGIEACRVINEIKLRLEAGSGFWSKLRQAGT